MNKLILLLFLSIPFSVLSQSKTVIITQSIKTVPAGKKWRMEVNKPIKIQLSEGSLLSGSFCNAMILSNPKMLYNINRGDIYNTEVFGIIFKNLEKVPYTNNITFSITPISFVDKNFVLRKFQNTSTEKVGANKLEFFSGETVFITNCIESLEMTELNMTQQDIIIQNNKKKTKEVGENQFKNNFKIPVNTQKPVEPGTKPEIHDENLSAITFTSNAVLWTKPNKGSSVDESDWTMSLTPKSFTMKSINFNKKFKVIGANYDEDFQSQRFSLTDENDIHNFDLLISYNKKAQYYSLIVTSIDHREEYQFQQVLDSEKLFQNNLENSTEIRILKDFNIPDYNSYYEKGDSPVYKFKKIKEIGFKCNNLLTIKNGTYTKSNSTLTISISPTEIIIKDVQKTTSQKYKVKEISFSDKFRSELFKISKDGQNYTHNLMLYYSSLEDNYTAIITSKNDKEELQFTKMSVE